MIIKLPIEIATDPRYSEVVRACSEVFITPTELSTRWRVSQQHLGNQRRYLQGPPWMKIGGDGKGAVRYRLADILFHELQGYEGALTPARLRLAILNIPEFSDLEKGLIASYLVAQLFPEK